MKTDRITAIQDASRQAAQSLCKQHVYESIGCEDVDAWITANEDRFDDDLVPVVYRDGLFAAVPRSALEGIQYPDAWYMDNGFVHIGFVH